MKVNIGKENRVASRVGQTHTRKQKLVTSEVNRIKMMYSY